MKIIGVMACTPSGVIGNNGCVPWRYDSEFAHFQKTIGNSPIIMGRKTFDALPKKFLKNRNSIVFSKDKDLKETENIYVVSSLNEFFNLKITDANVYMIGGGQLVKLFLEQHLISEFILTIINKEYPGDAFFPLELLNEYTKTIIEATDDYVIYRLTSAT